jgi:hypothetical protein
VTDFVVLCHCPDRHSASTSTSSRATALPTDVSADARDRQSALDQRTRDILNLDDP